MSYYKKKNEIYSDEVQEILSYIPPWIVRWGISTILFVILALLISSWVIKYPDTIDSQFVLTTHNPPVSIIARSNGRADFFVSENQIVYQKQFLGVIENSANFADLKWIFNSLDEFIIKMYNSDHPNKSLEFREDLDLGDLQSDYLVFLKSLREYVQFRELAYNVKQVNAVKSRILYYRQLNNQLKNQRNLFKKELNIIANRLKSDSSLYNQRVIAAIDLERTTSSYLLVLRNYESAQANIVNNEIQISQLETRLMELDNVERETTNNLIGTIEDASKDLQSKLDAWKQRFLLISPIEGRITFSKFWSDNQYVTSGEEVMTVVPPTQDLFGQIYTPITGSGKVEIGQKVNIRLDNYPYVEYGMVVGYIKSISLVPDDNMYTIRVNLPDGLLTTYNERLDFKQEMQGTAQIITKDLRLIQRIFNQFRALVDKSI